MTDFTIPHFLSGCDETDRSQQTQSRVDGDVARAPAMAQLARTALPGTSLLGAGQRTGRVAKLTVSAAESKERQFPNRRRAAYAVGVLLDRRAPLLPTATVNLQMPPQAAHSQYC